MKRRRSSFAPRLSMFARGLICFYAAVVTMLVVGFAILTESWWLVVLSAPIIVALCLTPLFLKCPKCDFPIAYREGHWPFETHKSPFDPICAKCGRDLRTC